MAATSFKTDLDTLIRRHLGTPTHSEDFDKVLWPLYETANRISAQSDDYPLREPEWRAAKRTTH